MSVLHVCLRVADVDRSVQWYESQLEFEYAWEFTHEGTRNVYVSDADGFELQLSAAADGELEAGDAWDHLGIEVEDVDAAFERIDHHGVVKPPSDYRKAGARAAFIEDPDGHVVELIETLDAS